MSRRWDQDSCGRSAIRVWRARDPALTEMAGHRHRNQSRVPDAVSRRRKAAPSTEDEPLKKSARSAVCAHHAPPACCGRREQLSCLSFDCSTMQCHKVEKHTKLPQYQSNSPPLAPLSPLTHSYTRVVLNSPPPNGELSLTVCSLPRPLSQFTEAWQALPEVLEWVMKSIKNGYMLQFFRRPPRFNGVLMSTVREQNASILREEIHNLLAKRAVETVPLADRESGFYSRYFLVPKKDGRLRPILDLRPLNCVLSKRSFKIITLRQILSHIRPRDWFISVDLKDAYFHIQVAPRNRRFLRFAFERIAYQFSILPFGLCLAPRTFTKCMEAALSPLKKSGMCILNYLDDCLVLAQSESALLSDKLRLLAHLQSLGLTVNMKKSMLVPNRNISFLGVELNSINIVCRRSTHKNWSALSQSSS